MKKYIIALIGFVMLLHIVSAQPATSKEQQELEKQRQQIKREIEQAQELLDNNRKTTKENMSTLAIINHKLNKQENVIENISREINLMDNNIFKSQKDVNKLQLVLDTLKEEYTRSMLYAYKSRSSSDFLNFVFSSPSFNDAIKRINYLKSYRSYREMQGENIASTQVLLKYRIDELSGNKQKKNVVLQIQSKEVDALQTQQEEKNSVVNKLKAQGKELNNQIAAKKKQMQKVNNAFAAAIKRSNDEARKLSAANKVSEDRNRRDAAASSAEDNNKKESTTSNKKTGKKSRTVTEPVNTKSVFLGTDAELSLNTNFERNKGNLPWPVNSGYLLLHYGLNKLGNGVEVISEGLSIGTVIGTPVKAIFDGEVKAVDNYDDLQMVVIKHGMYFTGYSNISGVNLKKGQMVTVGQVIGKVAANLDGVGAIDLMISKDKSELNPGIWLKPR